MRPRWYQDEAVQSTFTYFMNGRQGNPIVALPTGTGKSIVIGDFLRRVFALYSGQRTMMLTHVKELIAQNADKLLAIWPTAPLGIYSAGLKSRQLNHQITFAGIASVAKLAKEIGHIDLILVDECHLISPNEETMYQLLIKGLKEINPYLKVIGFTATPWRLGVGHLVDDGIFTDVCYDMTGLEAFNRLVSEGFLSPLVPKRTSLELDTSKVHVHAGEFKQNELQLAVDKEELTWAACKEMVEFGHDRYRWLVFASGVEHAEHIASMLDSLGVSTVVVHSKMKEDERDRRIAEFKSGKYRCAVNNNVLTTGFDLPDIDLIGVLRPTKSTVLWVQMLGRGTRPVYAPGFDLETIEGRLAAMAAGPKQNCLVLDFAGNTRSLGPINDPVLPKAKGKKGGGEAPVKICEECGTYNHASVRYCAHCGQEFPRELKIKKTAFTDELMKGTIELPQVETFQVDRVVYAEHQKEGRPPTLQVSYFCGLRMFKEWVCLEHEGFPKHKARDWWRERLLQPDPPDTIAEALESLNQLRTPTHIRVWINKKYPEVMAHAYDGEFGA